MEFVPVRAGVDCRFSCVASEDQEKGHNGDLQSDANPKC